MPRFAVILPAAGRSTRFGTDKLLAPLRGTPVIGHAIRAFLIRADVSAVIVAGPPGVDLIGRLPADLRASLAADGRVSFCDGGPTRAETVRLALAAVPASAEWVAVHDAARPLVSQELIDRVLAAAVARGAAGPALPVVATVKEADGPLPARVRRTPDRRTLWAMQTPQVARRADLIAAYDRCPLPWEGVTDDLQVLELAGVATWLVPGEERNVKVTTPADLVLATL